MRAAIIQGAIFVLLTVFLVLSQISLIKPEVSRVIGAGGVGIWFTMGYVMYLVVGVIGVAVSALFYLHLERNLGKTYAVKNIIPKILAWIHLIFMNVGTTAAMGMMMYAGYVGGASMLPLSIGGKGLDAAQTHQILSPFVEPIGAAILGICIGVFSGGLGFVIVYKKKI